MAAEEDQGFLSRWSRRKVQAKRGDDLPPAPETSPSVVAANAPKDALAPGAPTRSPAAHVPASTPAPQHADTAAPPPTLDDVALLTRESDYARFVSPGVSGEVRNAALKKLFTDPHFNVMDGLDTYIDDYNKPDPLPLSMLRQMSQSAFLGLAQEEKTPPGPPQAPAADPEQAEEPPIAAIAAADAAAIEPHDENPDLRLQSVDDPRPPGLEPGPGEDPRRPA
jgi:hypothetical protein